MNIGMIKTGYFFLNWKLKACYTGTTKAGLVKYILEIGQIIKARSSQSGGQQAILNVFFSVIPFNYFVAYYL